MWLQMKMELSWGGGASLIESTQVPWQKKKKHASENYPGF